jgi:uroporphyrinogen III methyltransferase/synthase
VKNFVNLLNRREKSLDRYTENVLIACIGPIAARAAHEIGLKVDIVADEYTIEGLLIAMRSYDDLNYKDRKINE